MSRPSIHVGYHPGSIGRISELHAAYYQKHWQFGLYFEAKVATEISQFLQRFDSERDGFWVVLQNGRIEGSIAVNGAHAETQGAHLRWFIVSEALHGKGIGRQLVRNAVEFCRSKGFGKMYLWTFEGLDVARRLYEEAGFRLIRQRSGEQWGVTVNEQYFELNFG